MYSTNTQLTPQPSFPHLDIVEGLHHGVNLVLEEAEYLVGANVEADIVLRDEGVLPNHAKLFLGKSELSVEATGGDVVIGQTRIAIGHGSRIRLPAKLTIGKAVLQIAPGAGGGRSPIDPRAIVDHAAQHPVTVASAALACAAAALFVSQAMRGAETDWSPVIAADLADKAFSETRNVGPLNAAALSHSSTESAVAELGEKLKEAGINTIRLNAGDGRVSAEGRLGDEQAADWTSVQRWFDTKYGSSAVLTTNVAIGPLSGPAPVRMQAVWFGQRSYIIAENGSRYYEGAILESGWIVQQIAENRVLLRKADETLALTYR
ncbi:MAG: FHA domain-containing protein [Rhodomicrobiaceae bacterium]